MNEKKIKVVFMLTRPVFWNIYEKLYYKMKETSKFDPVVFLCGETKNHVWAVYPEEIPEKLYNRDKPLHLSTHTLSNLVDLMDKRDIKYIRGYDEQTGEFESLEVLQPDILFYCDPYDSYYIKDEWKPGNASKKYKTAYIHYAYLLNQTLEFYKYPIFSSAWRVFIESEHHIKIAEKELNRELPHFIPLGSPKFDNYYEDENKGENISWRKSDFEKLLVYAPHWSVSPKENRAISWYGNFIEHFEYFVGVANKNKNIQWVIKPHPLLFPQITHSYGVQKTEEIMSIIQSSDNIEIYTGHDYVKLFQASEGLILDSNSFVAEYMPTGKPILFLQKKKDLKLNVFGEEIYKGCYFGDKKESIEGFLKDIILGNNDSLKEDREKIVENYILLDKKDSPSTGIFNYLSENL